MEVYIIGKNSKTSPRVRRSSCLHKGPFVTLGVQVLTEIEQSIRHISVATKYLTWTTSIPTRVMVLTIDPTTTMARIRSTSVYSTSAQRTVLKESPITLERAPARVMTTVTRQRQTRETRTPMQTAGFRHLTQRQRPKNRHSKKAWSLSKSTWTTPYGRGSMKVRRKGHGRHFIGGRSQIHSKG